MRSSLADVDSHVELPAGLPGRNGRWAKTVKDGRLALIEDFVWVQCPHNNDRHLNDALRQILPSRKIAAIKNAIARQLKDFFRDLRSPKVERVSESLPSEGHRPLICSARFTAGHGNLLSVRLNADMKGDYSQPGLMPGRYLEEIDLPSACLAYAVGRRLRSEQQLTTGGASFRIPNPNRLQPGNI
jgi:hypothetical protein